MIASPAAAPSSETSAAYGGSSLRKTADAAAAPPGLELRLFGGFAADVGGTPMRALRTRHGSRLLALLALANGREELRTTLAGRLWPDSPSDAAAASLRRALTDLRDALGPEATRLESTTYFTLRLDLSGDAACDVLAFDRAIAEGTPAALDRAIALYRGPLMPDLDAVLDLDGALGNGRDQRQATFLRILEQRAQSHRSAGETVQAISDLRRLLAADPLCETASRGLMELLAATADRAGALTEYLRLRRTLARELDTKPERATRDLYAHIQTDDAGTGKQGTHPVVVPASPARRITAGGLMPPTGLVTLLFAELLDDDSAMRLRAAIDANEGVVYSANGAEGLSLRAAFAFPLDALAATESGEGKMAVHTGIATLQDGTYVGPLVSGIRDLLRAAHFGQTLLSSVTAGMMRDLLPPALGLRDLGKHRFQGGGAPERVFQLTRAGRAENYPPIRSLDDVPNNLPSRVTSFIGRDAEAGEIRDLLRNHCLLTLTGTGGVGKTRLAQYVAAEALDEYPDGVWQVELAPLADSTLVLQTVASALGVKEQAEQSLIEALTDYLKPKRLLLLVDNCEHVLSASAALVSALIRVCPQVRVIATSREPLGISGETTYRVPTLSIPSTLQAKDATPETLSQFDSARLFVDRARSVKPDFALTNTKAPALAQLCFRLDGIPLAIELAAARVRSLTVEEINSKLDSRFRLLTNGDRTALPRQQTFRALIDWSYDLLTDSEKTLLARLSVFAGGWTLEAAEVVCAGELLENEDVLDLLTSLVDKSLILSEEVAGEGATRYRMLETIRQYSAERLSAISEEASVSERHVSFFVRFAEEAAPQLTQPDQVRWLDRLETEHDNLRAALDTCAAQSTQSAGPRAAALNSLRNLRLSGAMLWFWDMRGYLPEGRAHLARALAGRHIAEQASKSGILDVAAVKKAVADATFAAGRIAMRMGDYPASQSLYAESLILYRELGDADGIGSALTSLGRIAQAMADFPEAHLRHEEALAFCREVGDRQGIAAALGNLGGLNALQGHYPEARALIEESLPILREIGNKHKIAAGVMNLGVVAEGQGDNLAASLLYDEGLTIYREIGDKNGIANCLTNLGTFAHLQGDYTLSRLQLEEGLSLYREIGNKYDIAEMLVNLGSAVLDQGLYSDARSFLRECLVLSHPDGDKRVVAVALQHIAVICAFGEGNTLRAAALWAASIALPETIDLPSSVLDPEERDNSIAKARAALNDEAAWTAAWAEGAALSIDEVVELALRK